MITKDQLQGLLGNTLLDAKFDRWEDRYRKGKVRDMYVLPGRRVLVTTDRQSAFDHVLGTIPLKGQVLNRIAQYWFDRTRDIAPNHVIDVPHPNVLVAEELDMFPVEIVVRGYLTGSTDTSVWTHYAKGVRDFCGNRLPHGMVKNKPFDFPIVTPTTKSDEHDESISPQQIVERDLVDGETWAEIETLALALFARGQKLSAEQGLILVDTKYEMGRNAAGEIAIADEIHTPDSSRYWIAASYPERHARGEEPESLDKEFLRLWLRDNGISDDNIPELDDEIRVQVAERYIDLFQRVTGQNFDTEVTDEPLHTQIERVLEPLCEQNGAR
ncbi:MAG: phosphoribosylaminoimidazolesuccinocarboxamide synthase [Candidatus Latescibacterota bacterium]|nr:phosphoribosylaminoimidazolesuccinocarboxamide synthase [Candidatus Latescibacterota bacterium]